MYVGVFDLKHRLDHSKKILKDKIRLRELLEDDIKELEQSIKDLEDMISKSDKAVLV